MLFWPLCFLSFVSYSGIYLFLVYPSVTLLFFFVLEDLTFIPRYGDEQMFVLLIDICILAEDEIRGEDKSIHEDDRNKDSNLQKQWSNVLYMSFFGMRFVFTGPILQLYE